ncbi:protein TonB [Bacterioplanes sanyensis]|uniref:Protein TonB n=1 Tax=Bacterioplanes sanyensis TaxID=1249553 RepID=A0A222FKI7_9GAMM|nr:energy transducer TonB [Bacterioplanes sanyensis]ASP39290.1 protein TonB [Bacterioplanes sanyensis]
MQSAFVRFGASLAIAAVATFAVFWVMQSLISSGGSVLNEQDYGRIESFVMQKPDDEVQTKERKPKKPPTPPQEPPKPDMPKPDLAKASTDGFDVGGFDIGADLNVDAGLGGVNTSDGEYLPIVKVAPNYPRRAAQRGIEGYVVVEFTVTKLGTVSNPRVIEAEPKGIFDRAALKAAAKFKYKPKVVDGQPIEVPGVRNIIRFELDKG